MDAVSTELVAPRLAQTVRWAEHYVSCALNAKFAGIIKPGIYRGYTLKPAGKMLVRVENGDSCRSVAVVERNGYSITATMLDPGTVSIPAPGTWYICIEALYEVEKPGYQKTVVVASVEPHHVVIGRVEVPNAESEITSDMIFTDERQQSEIPSRDEFDDLWAEFKKLHDEFLATQQDVSALANRKQRVWEISTPLPAEALLDLPIPYIVGTNSLRLNWDGIPLTPGVNFDEHGSLGQTSSSVTLHFPVPAGAEFHAVVMGLTTNLGGTPTIDLETGAYYGPISVGTSLDDMKNTGLLILLESKK